MNYLTNKNKNKLVLKSKNEDLFKCRPLLQGVKGLKRGYTL